VIRACELQYDQLPEDFSEAEEYWGSAGNCETSAGTGTETCNGDGVIDYNNGLESTSDNPYESWRVWEHLQNAGVLSSGLTGIATADKVLWGVNIGFSAGVNVPAGALEDSLFTIFYIHGSRPWGGG
jgi:hypothetical protein